MKVAIIYNRDLTGVINRFGMQNKEKYNPKTVKLIADALERGGHNVRVIDGNMNVVESLHEFMPRVIEGERMGMVFNMAYGIQGEGRYTHLPAMLEMLGIPYIGSGPTGHALALDKVITKIMMQKHDISTPDFWVFSNPDEVMSQVIFPVIVKPKMEAVSYGLRIVNDEAGLRDAVKYVISEFQQQALVEQFIRGREFCVGLLGNNNPEAFPVLEIDLENNPDAIQSVDEKKYRPLNKICPANISQDLSSKMIKLSKDAFKALELKDFARVDIRMDEKQNIYLLEINSMASLGRTGSYVYAANVAGYDYEKLVNKILDVAAVRYFSESILPVEDTKNIKQKAPLNVRIRGFIRSHQQKTEKLLKDMVNINSYVRNVDGVNAIGNLIMKNLSPLGFIQQVIPQVEVGNILLLSNVPNRNFDVLLLSHLDCNIPFKKQQNYRETEQLLYGTAIWGNKGGLAIMISALQALRFVRLLRKLRLGILLTSDHSLRGRLARKHVIELIQNTNAIIGLKGGGPGSSVITSRSGASPYNCQMILEKGVNSRDVSNAVAAFARLITHWVEMTDESKGIVIAPSNVEIKSDIVDKYAHAEAILRVRFNEPKQIKELDRKIRHLAKKTNSGSRIQIEGSIIRPPMLRTEKVEIIWQRVKNIANSLDIRLIEEHRWSSADICFVNRDIPILDGMGPIGVDHVGSDEYIIRHSLIERGVLLAMLLYDLYKEPL